MLGWACAWWWRLGSVLAFTLTRTGSRCSCLVSKSFSFLLDSDRFSLSWLKTRSVCFNFDEMLWQWDALQKTMTVPGYLLGKGRWLSRGVAQHCSDLALRNNLCLILQGRAEGWPYLALVRSWALRDLLLLAASALGLLQAALSSSVAQLSV